MYTRLPTRWRRPARLTWLVLVVLLLWLSAYDIWRLIVGGQTATYLLAWRIVMPIGFLTIGGVVFWRKMDDWLGLLTSFALISLGVSLISASFARDEVEAGRVKLIDLQDAVLYRELGLAYRRDRTLSVASTAFVALLRQFATQMKKTDD